MTFSQLKCFVFCGKNDFFLQSLACIDSQVSASRQNFQNLVGDFLGNGSSNLHAKNEPSSFKTEGAL